MKRILIIVCLIVLLSVGVSGIRFKNAVLLDEDVFTDFGVRLNDSFEVTGDINVSLVNNSDNSKNYNFIGYSSKTSINVDDVIFYKQDGISNTYQNAKTNGWIEGINLSSEGVVGNEATTLTEYGAYWVRSFLAVNMTFPNVGGSNTSSVLKYNDILFFNGTDYLNITDAGIGSANWIDQGIQFWSPTGIFGGSFDNINQGDNLNTWTGYVIFSFKPNIFLLFENKTLQNKKYEIEVWVKKDGVVIKEYHQDNWVQKQVTQLIKVLDRLFGFKK